nr:hypothetical protein Q903MT_gene3212 [Picea sitchensis]
MARLRRRESQFDRDSYPNHGACESDLYLLHLAWSLPSGLAPLPTKRKVPVSFPKGITTPPLLLQPCFFLRMHALS